MNNPKKGTQVNATVTKELNQLLRRVGLTSNKPSLSLNAKVKRTYPKCR